MKEFLEKIAYHPFYIFINICILMPIYGYMVVKIGFFALACILLQIVWAANIALKYRK